VNQSLFRRLVFIFLVITVTLTVTASIGLSRFFARYFLEQKQKELLAQASRINTLADDYQSGRLSNTEFKKYIELISYTSNARVYVVNVRSETMAALESRIPSGLIERDLLREIEQVLRGETVRSQRFVSTLDMPVVFVGTPLRIERKVTGVILMLAPLTAVKDSLAAVNRVLWYSSLFIVAVAVIVIFAVSRRITRPIADMSRAAARIANGDYSQEVAVPGRDEVAQLACSFNIMQRKLREMENMRQELIASISHELRTPLSSIRGFVQAIKDGVAKPEEQPRYLSLVLDETTRLAGLVSDLLELARIQAGDVQLADDEFDLTALIAEVGETFSLPATEKSIVLVAKADPAPLWVNADRDRIKQVLLNLLSNALRYTPRGGTVSIEARRSPGAAMISVADTGPGVPPEELARIFDKFHRLDKSRDSATGGTGLGLAIAKQLVGLHGGSIFATNRYDGPGLTVSFSIPDDNGFSKKQDQAVKTR
jgi:signal transduction histidine kinase